MFQGVFAYFSKLYALDLPLRAGGKLSLEGEQQLDGSAQLQAVVFGDKLDGHCKLGAQSAIDLDMRLKQDRATAELGVRTDGGGLLRGKVDARLDLNALNGSEPLLGPTSLELQAKEIAIHKLPGLCNLADGRASFMLTATGGGKQRPTLDMNGTIANLRAPNNDPMTVRTRAHAGGPSAELRADFESAGKSLGTLAARVGLAYPDGTTPAIQPSAPLDAQLHLDRLPLANVLAFTRSAAPPPTWEKPSRC